MRTRKRERESETRLAARILCPAFLRARETHARMHTRTRATRLTNSRTGRCWRKSGNARGWTKSILLTGEFSVVCGTSDTHPKP